MRSDRGEQERELRAAAGTLVLDTDVAHQHYFISQRLLAASGPIPIVVPAEGRQYQLTVTELGEESIQIAGRSLESRHLQLVSGQETRDLWIDSEGRVLRIADPGRGYTATRTTLP